ncbi:phosphonate C-P lyase system protein PhnG [Chelativorans sp. ZYF759]|uniref:phosphonate C-P lyase system protein PhnG n=1 Tax=Chelativorans sp. ZYF759 TaxID=2692213 RepID=UPI0021109EDE|nr:phosphonate C-P lyase system protein PhnG [Chelativorans sp. ZYF759]
MDPENTAVDVLERRKRMAVLAGAAGDELRRLWRGACVAVEAIPVRGPETGLATVRGRIGGGGSPFNVGEVTVTRATVRLPDGRIGHAYAIGRDHEKARISATIDALCHDPVWASRLEAAVVAPLAAAQQAADTRKREETAATKVDFFTMVRGED